MKPTDEQVKKFWEKCGFEYRPMISVKYEKWVWYYPDTPYSYLELPPIDLNNLFRYAVPKVLKYDVVLVCKGEREYEASTWESPNGKQITYTEARDPALALFWAIWEVLE